MKQNEGEQFKKKREQFEINLRKTNRQQVLMKRRNLQQFEMGEKPQEIKDKEIIIVDQNLSTFLKQVLPHHFEYKDLPILIGLLSSENIYDKHRGVIGLRSLSKDPTQKLMDAMLNKNIIKMLAEMCDQNMYPQLKFQVYWLFTNLSSFSKQASIQIVQSKIIPIVAESINDSNEVIGFQAIWLCGNLAAEETKYRNELIQIGCIMKILKFVETAKKNTHIITSVWTLTNLVRGEPKPKYDAVKYAVPTIAQALIRGIIKSNDVISDCLWALSNLSDGPKMRVQRLMQTNVVPTVMKYLQSQYKPILIPAIRIIGNFTTGTKQQTNQILKHNFLDAAYKLLFNAKQVVVKQTCWALSNITAGTNQQILQFLQRTDIIQKLLELYPTLSPETKLEIIWIFTNMERSEGPELILQVYEGIGLVNMIGEMLKQKNNNVVYDAIICLERILAMGQRLRKQMSDSNQIVSLLQKYNYGPVLEDLQHNKSDKIYQGCLRILRRYFNIEQQQMIEQ